MASHIFNDFVLCYATCHSFCLYFTQFSATFRFFLITTIFSILDCLFWILFTCRFNSLYLLISSSYHFILYFFAPAILVSYTTASCVKPTRVYLDHIIIFNWTLHPFYFFILLIRLKSINYETNMKLAK